MIGKCPDFQNKISFDNYVYYKMIHKKIKYNSGTVMILEILYMFETFLFYWSELKSLFMPAFLVILIKNIFIILYPKKRKALISLLTDTTAIIIMLVQGLYLQNGFDLFNAFTINVLYYPIVFVHIISIKNEYIDESLSQLLDYPYFSLDRYTPNEKAEYTEFNDDINDKLLKTAIIDITTNNNSKKLRIAKYCTCIAILISLVFFLISQSALIKIKNTDKFSFDNYTQGQYINVDIMPETMQIAVQADTKKELWVKISDSNNYIYVKCKENTYEKLIKEKTANIKGKVVFSKKGEIKNMTLSKSSVNEAYAFITEKQKEYIDSISDCNMYIDIIDEKLKSNTIFYSLISLLAFFALYMLLIIVPRKENSII